MELIVTLFVGLVAGAFAGMVVKGRGLGIIGDTIVGLIGGFIGKILFTQLGVVTDGSIINSIIVSFIGAVILLFIVKMLIVERR